jgi:hypothetical protein
MDGYPREGEEEGIHSGVKNPRIKSTQKVVDREREDGRK